MRKWSFPAAGGWCWSSQEEGRGFLGFFFRSLWEVFGVFEAHGFPGGAERVTNSPGWDGLHPMASPLSQEGFLLELCSGWAGFVLHTQQGWIPCFPQRSRGFFVFLVFFSFFLWIGALPFCMENTTMGSTAQLQGSGLTVLASFGHIFSFNEWALAVNEE